MTRIVLITRRFWPLVGGAERSTANLATALAMRGVEVTVLTAQWELHWPAEFNYCDVRVTRLPPAPSGRWNTFRYFQAIARWLRNARDLDLVHVSMLRQEAYAAVRALSGSVPVVLRAETAGPGGDCQWQRGVACGRQIQRKCAAADALIAPTATIEQELLAAGYPRPRIHTLATGVPIQPPGTPENKAAARATLASANPALTMPADVPLAVYVGRLDRTRGLTELVLAWRAVVARQPDARLWLIGEGPFGAALQNYIEDRRLAGRVVLGGVFDHVDDVLSAADIFILPTATGGAPLGMMEAMAAGLPIVTQDAADFRELLTDGDNAILVRAPTAERLAAFALRLFEDRELALRLGAGARWRVANRFSLERMGDEHMQLFESLMQPKPLVQPRVG